VLTARQPGARFAPLHFLSGGLFSQDIHRIYEAVSQPVWMSHAVSGDFKDFRGKRLVRDRGNWHTSVYQTGALPYFEGPSAFFQEFDAFLAGKTSDRSNDTLVRARQGSSAGLTWPAQGARSAAKATPAPLMPVVCTRGPWGVTTTNWSNPLLDARQMIYAANDVFVALLAASAVIGAERASRLRLSLPFAPSRN